MGITVPIEGWVSLVLVVLFIVEWGDYFVSFLIHAIFKGKRKR